MKEEFTKKNFKVLTAPRVLALAASLGSIFQSFPECTVNDSSYSLIKKI